MRERYVNTFARNFTWKLSSPFLYSTVINGRRRYGINDSCGIVNQLWRLDWKGWRRQRLRPFQFSDGYLGGDARCNAARRGAFHFPRKIYDVNQMHVNPRQPYSEFVARAEAAGRVLGILNSAAGTIWLRRTIANRWTRWSGSFIIENTAGWLSGSPVSPVGFNRIH